MNVENTTSLIHTATWVVIFWILKLSDIITVSFCLNLHDIFTYVHKRNTHAEYRTVDHAPPTQCRLVKITALLTESFTVRSYCFKKQFVTDTCYSRVTIADVTNLILQATMV